MADTNSDIREIQTHPARVLATRAHGPTEQELMALARRAAPDPSVFDDHPPYFWPAEISSNRVDAYFTRMHSSTLRNFAEDASAGTAFLNSHRSGGMCSQAELPIGQSLSGQYFGRQGNGIERTEADYYTARGLKLNDVSTDDFIDGIRAGIARDVSVGFYGADYNCDVCQRWMMTDYECDHTPGLYYEAKNLDEEARERLRLILAEVRKRAPREDMILATASIHNGRLAETSSVYDGATPGAAIMKARREIEIGRMRPEVVEMLEQRYRMRLPHPATQFHIGIPAGSGSISSSGWAYIPVSDRTNSFCIPSIPHFDTRDSGRASSRQEENRMEPTGEEMMLAGLPDEQREAWHTLLGSNNGVSWRRALKAAKRLGYSCTRDVGEQLEITATRVEDYQRATERCTEWFNRSGVEIPDNATLEVGVQHLAAEIERLRPLADEGSAYRADLIKAAIEAGVRAYGNDFATEQYQAMLASASLEMVKRMAADWEKVAAETFKPGRVTVDVGEREPAKPRDNGRASNAAYQV